MARADGTIMIEGAQLIRTHRNFTGREGKYNAEGVRSFSVFLDPDLARDLAKDGWNVKWLASREPGEDDRPFLPVFVSYRIRPPRINMITSRGRTPLGEDEVELLDEVEFKHVDLIIRPREWETGRIKAYLQKMFVTIEEDELDLKYKDVE